MLAAAPPLQSYPHFDQLQNGIGHIKVDNNILQTSRDWGRRFEPVSLAQEKQGAAAVINKATGAMRDMQQASLKREAYETELNSLKQEMGPYVAQSADRMRQFCDYIGVTDRYTGYRHNLNRSFRDPTRLGSSWQNNSPGSYNTLVSPSYQERSAREAMRLRTTKSAPAASVLTSGIARTKPTHTTKSIQEQCGINMTFPGYTEYMQRYDRPDTSVTRSYNINPSPNFYMFGRPLTKLAPARSITEYQFRYEWPDGAKIASLPWLRK